MVRTETHSTACLLDRLSASSGARPASEAIAFSASDQTRLLSPPCDRAEGSVPRWDSLWVDLGGEG
jgi:hypothetical protein